MSNERTEQQPVKKPQAKRLSPELREVLHMLQSLENQQAPAPQNPTER